jgi:hypothetical protein
MDARPPGVAVNTYELKHYILDGHEVVETDMWSWARWFGEADRRVAKDDVGAAWVSTVFLGIDHQFIPGGPLEIFETMVFENGTYREHYTERYSTWDEAVDGHRKVVTMVALALGEDLP